MWNSEGRLACTLRLGAVTVNAEVACACSRPSIALVTIAECWVMATLVLTRPLESAEEAARKACAAKDFEAVTLVLSKARLRGGGGDFGFRQ